MTCNVYTTYHWGTLAKPLFPCQSNKYYILWVCVCCLMYPACNAHAASSYCHLWPARLYSIFPHYLINGTIVEKTLLDIKCVFWFLYNLCLAFLILRKIQRDIIINVYMSSKNVHVFKKTYICLQKTYICLQKNVHMSSKNVHMSSKNVICLQKTYICLQKTYPLFWSDFNKTWICYIYVRKIIKFHENPSRGSRVDPCGRAGGRT
jgi:hypothetical protein